MKEELLLTLLKLKQRSELLLTLLEAEGDVEAED